MNSSTTAVLGALARWFVLAVGVTLTTWSFVQLVEVHNQFAHASPWWWRGLIGVGLTVLALGLPWSRRGPADAAPPEHEA